MHRQSHAVGRIIRVTVAIAVAAIPFVIAAPAAFAGVGFGVTPTFPTTVTVGQTALPASIQVSNTSTAPESGGTITINAVNLVPACGTIAFTGNGNCPAVSADPGVFQIGATGTGEATTACAGKTFNITVADAATGQVTFASTSTPIVLTAPLTANSVCRIDFTFAVLKTPAKPVTATGNMALTNQIGFASGTSSVNEFTGTGSGSSGMTVTTPPATTTTTTTTPRPTTSTPGATVAPVSSTVGSGSSTTISTGLALTGESAALPLAGAAGLLIMVLAVRQLRRRTER